MSAVSIPTPTTRGSRRTMAWRARWGLPPSVWPGSSRFLDLLLDEAQVIHVALHFGQCVRWNCPALGHAQGLQPVRCLSQVWPEAANPRRARLAFRRLIMRVPSPTKLWRSRPGRFASSFARVGIAAMLQCLGSPRSQPRKARLSSSVSSRSVLAPVLARYRDARRVDHVGLDLSGAQPAC
jgi:hypothetical protein